MIYISSACVKAQKIKDAVEILCTEGFDHIELTGGTQDYPQLEEDLLEIKKQRKVSLLCHNYFPPPPKHFVLNLASLNDEIYSATLANLKRSVQLSAKLESDRFAFHAGFFIDLSAKEIGQKIGRYKLFDRRACLERFVEGYRELEKLAGNLKLYVENNVLSAANAKTYEGTNPLMLTCARDYFELKEMLPGLRLLLDVGHLKVSAKSQGLDFESELRTLLNETDYLHLSENDAKEDLNHTIGLNSPVYRSLKSFNLTDKTLTLEYYSSISEIKESYQFVRELQGIV